MKSQAQLDREQVDAVRCTICGENPAGGHRLMNIGGELRDCPNAGAAAPTYRCRFCGETKTASRDDITTARAEAYGDEPKELSDARVFELYGREICPRCTGEEPETDDDA